MTKLKEKKEALENIRRRIAAAQTQVVNRKKQGFIRLTAALDAMSPLKVLTRGYAMVQTENGQLLRSVSQVEQGSRVKVSFSDGTLTASVLDKKENIG